jgi:Concanavalin A-like lectin/glucanases superfamily
MYNNGFFGFPRGLGLVYNLLSFPRTNNLWNFFQAPGLIWIKADEPALITESGGVISSIADKSTVGNVLSGATIGNRPIYGTQLNGKNTIFFDGTNDRLDSTVSVFDHRAAHTVFALLKYTVAPRGTAFGNSNLAGTRGAFLDLNSTANTFRYQIQPAGVFTPATNGLTLNTYFIVALVVGLTSQAAYVNGTFVGSASISINSGSAPDPFSLGRYSVLGNTLFFGGNIAELFISSKVFDNAEIFKGFGYLAHEWGVTSLLPETHPYKSIAPTI